MPPPIFLRFWPAPSQFTSATTTTTNFYLSGEGQRHTKKKKLPLFFPFSSFIFLIFSIALRMETRILKFAVLTKNYTTTKKESNTSGNSRPPPIQLSSAPLMPPLPEDFGNPPPSLILPQHIPLYVTIATETRLSAQKAIS